MNLVFDRGKHSYTRTTEPGKIRGQYGTPGHIPVPLLVTYTKTPGRVLSCLRRGLETPGHGHLGDRSVSHHRAPARAVPTTLAPTTVEPCNEVGFDLDHWFHHYITLLYEGGRRSPYRLGRQPILARYIPQQTF